MRGKSHCPEPPESVPGTRPHEQEYRIERDTMGEVRVPIGAKYGAQTQRAVANFSISGMTLSRHHIAALAQIKRAAAVANYELGVFDEEVAAAIACAADQVIAGYWDEHFPVDVFQTGSGTSSNMNANEVIARLASEMLGAAVHPNDDVNASQSSNDVFPASIHIAATQAISQALVPALEILFDSLLHKSRDFADIVKAGRTHLMDATPVTLGQEFGGYAAQIAAGIARVCDTLPRLAQLPLGGTAVGTGINTPPGFPQRVIALVSEHMDLEFTEAPNHFAAKGSMDALVEASGALRSVAVALIKIANDLRWMGSGPRTGLAEIRLPDLQPGSSIMPGKVNPVIPEAVAMVGAQVIGNDTTVAFAGASGSFELNVMLPVIARNVLESITLISGACVHLAKKCVDGIQADADRCLRYAQSSPSIVTPLNRIIGYENAAAIAKHAVSRGLTIREAAFDLGVVARGALSAAELDAARDVRSMTRPPIS